MTTMTEIDYRPTFEDYERRRPELRKWLMANYVLAFDLEPGRLLDVGCGEGFWGSLFAELDYSVCGFDANADFIETGRQKYPELNLRVGTAEDPPFDSPFDVIFCRTLPHFYGPELGPARVMLEGLTSLAEPTGLLLVSCYTDGSGESRPSLHGVPLWHHRYDSLCNTVADAGWTITAAHRAGKYLQIGAILPRADMDRQLLDMEC